MNTDEPFIEAHPIWLATYPWGLTPVTCATCSTPISDMPDGGVQLCLWDTEAKGPTIYLCSWCAIRTLGALSSATADLLEQTPHITHDYDVRRRR
jgi:hypothetical protein